MVFINNIEKLRESLQMLQNDLDKPKKEKDNQQERFGLNDSLLVLIDHFIDNIIKNQVRRINYAKS